MACNCPEGYILLEDGVTCQQITHASPTPPAVKVAIDTNIEGGATPGYYGLLVYENITSNQSGGTKQWPLLLTPQVAPGVTTLSVIPTTGPNWTSIFPAGNVPDGEHQLVTTPLPGVWPPFPNMNMVSFGTCLRESVVTSNVLYYGTGNPVLPTANQQTAPWAYGTWANEVGVWPSDLGLTNYKWVGLSTCINVETETTYYVLFTANNAFRIKVDGQLAVEMNVGDGMVLPLGFVNAFPITLSPGIHVINVEAFNFSGGGQFSCDILNISEVDLLGINSLVSIEPYRVFSTKWKKPRVITATSNGTTTITTAGAFLPTDVGAFLNIAGYPPDTYIVQVVDSNTAIVNQIVPVMIGTGDLYFIWESGNTVDNTWTCAEGYTFGNCGGPDCFQVLEQPCTPVTDGCFLLTPCKEGLNSFVVNNNLGDYVGKVVTICPDMLPAPTPAPVQTGVLFRSLPNDTHDYMGTLTSCCPGINPVYTNNNSFASYEGIALFIPSLGDTCWTYSKGTNGHDNEAVTVDVTDAYAYTTDCATCQEVNPCIVVPTLNQCECYTVSSTICQNSITLTLTQPLQAQDTCEKCEDARVPKCYFLVNCEAQETITTDTDLSAYVDSVIKIETCPDKCWRVFESPNCLDAVSIPLPVETFADCQTCLPPAPEEVPINLKTRAVKPGFYTPGCPPEYTLKVNCKFAEAVYREMLVLRYGITPCCDQEDLNWMIKKEMLELNAIYDPSLCPCPTTDVQEDC